jgi:hypothetical protein
MALGIARTAQTRLREDSSFYRLFVSMPGRMLPSPQQQASLRKRMISNAGSF